MRCLDPDEPWSYTVKIGVRERASRLLDRPRFVVFIISSDWDVHNCDDIIVHCGCF